MSRFTQFLAAAITRNRAAIAFGLTIAVTSSGTAAAVSYLVLGGPNSASATTTLSSSTNAAVLAIRNTNSGGGTSAKGLAITVPSGRAPITVNSSAGKATNLNADKLDGKDSTAFGLVRDFAQSTNSASDPTPLLTFRSITLHRLSYVNTTLWCQLNLSSSAAGLWTMFQVRGSTLVSDNGMLPVTGYPLAYTTESDVAITGQVVILDSSTKRVATIQFSVYAWPDNGGCSWQGTLTAGV